MSGPDLASQVRVIEMGSGTDAGAIARAEDDLRRLPGVGAVVVLDPSGEPAAVVTYRHLERAAGSDKGLAGLVAFLAVKSYSVVDQQLDLWAPPAVQRDHRLLRFVAGKLRDVVRVPLHQRVAHGRRRWRRRVFLARLRWEAWLSGSTLDLQVSKDLYVEPGVRFQLARGAAALVVGPRCRLLGGTVLRLRGELLIGPGCEIRQDVSVNVKGRLELRGRNVIGKGAMLHADGHMLWEWGACVAEYATVLDTHHELDGSLVQMLDQGVTAMPITLGAASFVGSKASVMPGVTIGRASVVGAGSVVTRDVPEGAVVVGIPARPLPR